MKHSTFHGNFRKFQFFACNFWISCPIKVVEGSKFSLFQPLKCICLKLDISHLAVEIRINKCVKNAKKKSSVNWLCKRTVAVIVNRFASLNTQNLRIKISFQDFWFISNGSADFDQNVKKLQKSRSTKKRYHLNGTIRGRD